MTTDQEYCPEAGEAFPLLDRTVRAAFRADGAGPGWRASAVRERLAAPDRLARFRVLWTADGGGVRTAAAFAAAYDSLPGCGAMLLQPGLTADQTACRAFLGMLTGALTGGPPGVVCGADLDPAALSDGESMRFCRSFMDGLTSFAPGSRLLAAVRNGPPPRERDYLSARAGMTPPEPEPEPEPAEACARAAGIGLCLCADEALRRVRGAGLYGWSVAVSGAGETARAAEETALRMGARLTTGRGDVHLLCGGGSPLDEGGAAAILAQAPAGVFEGAPLACGPEAAAILAEGDALFLPCPAAGAGAALRALRPELSEWELRGVMRRFFRRILENAAGDGGLWAGVCAAALRRAAEILIRQGV